MSVSLPNGSTVAIASAYGSAKTVTTASNANPTVLGSTGHGYSDGDYVEFTSGWSKATDRIFRVDNKTTDAFEAEGLNTLDTDKYPAGSGTGTVRKIDTFTQLSQITNSSSEGGEQQFLPGQTIPVAPAGPEVQRDGHRVAGNQKPCQVAHDIDDLPERLEDSPDGEQGRSRAPRNRQPLLGLSTATSLS